MSRLMNKMYSQNDMYDFCKEDKMIIKSLKVPVPQDEFMRIKVLRQTELLDSTQSDPEFDRYTSMARRIFQVPIALISLVDLDRQWFKSKFGLDADQTHRDLAFCSYTVLPQSPDVFVVTNALNDVRFRDTALVTGYPHIRFYAGAALIVNGVKLGSLCVIDTVPRENFSLDDKMTLMDIGQAVATLIRERRESILNLQQDREMMVMNIVHNIRTPLMSAQMSCAMLNEDRLSLIRILKTSNNTNGTKLIANLISSLDDLDASLKKVKEATDTSIGVSEIILNKHLQYGTGEGGSGCHSNNYTDTNNTIMKDNNDNDFQSILKLDRFSLNDVMSELARAFTDSANMRTNKCDTSWSFGQPFAKKIFLSNLKNIKYSIITTMNTLSNDFANLAVHFDFQFSNNSECNLKDMTNEQREGHFMIKIKVTVPKGSSSKTNDSNSNNSGGCVTISQSTRSIFGTTSTITPSLSAETINIHTKQQHHTTTNNINDPSVYIASDFCPLPSPRTKSTKQKISSIMNDNSDLPLVFSKTFLSITNNIEKIERALIHADGQFKFRILKDDFSVLEFVAKFPCATEDVNSLSPRSENGSKLSSSIRNSNHSTHSNHNNKGNLNHHGNNNNNRSSSNIGIDFRSDGHNTTYLSSSPSSPTPPHLHNQSSNKSFLSESRQLNSSTNSLNNSMNNGSGSSSNSTTTNNNANNFHSSTKSNNYLIGNEFVTTTNSNRLIAVTDDENDDEMKEEFFYAPLEKIRVVVVEDSVPIQRVMKRMLESKGCTVDIAANGKLGLECFLTKQYDLAFLDFLMPVLSGLDLMQEYSDFRLSGISAIKTATSASGKKAFSNTASGNKDINESMMIWGMSATASTADQDLGKKLGMHLFTQKPLDNRLVDIMLNILNTAKLQQQRHAHRLQMAEVDQILGGRKNKVNESKQSYDDDDDDGNSMGGNVKEWVNLFEIERKKQQTDSESKHNDSTTTTTVTHAIASLNLG